MKIRLGADKRIEIFVIIEFILAFLINFCTVILNNKVLVSIFFNLSFVIFFMLFLDFIIRFKKMSVWIVLLVTLSILNVILGYVLDNFVFFEISKIKYLIFFIVTNIFYYMLAKIKITERLYKVAINVPFFIILSNIVAYYIIKNRETIAHGITLNFSNPNQTGIWLSVAFMFGILKCAVETSKLKKIIFLGLDLMLLPIIIKTLNRNSLISIVVLVILIIYEKIFRKKFYSKYLLILIIVSPCIFLVSYLALINSTFMENFSFLVSEGKSLTSRLGVWSFGVESFFENPIIGNYVQIMNYKFQQLHNTGIDICAKYGIIVYFVFVILNYKIVNTINKKRMNKINFLALCCFLTIFIQGIFEAGIYSGYCGLDYLIGGFIIIGRGIKNNSILLRGKI